MAAFEKINENIYKLRVPFESLYTSVFLIVTDEGAMLIDCATTPSDVRDIIAPAVCEMGVDITMLALTHMHGDHAGGLRSAATTFEKAAVCGFALRIKEICPDRRVKILHDGDMLLGCIKALQLPGHSHDTIGYLDTRSGTLIGGDAVQLYGIGRYGCGVGNPDAYRASLNRLCGIPIEMYVASHEFVPLGSVAGGSAVKEYFAEALADFERVCDFVKENLHLGDKEIAESFTAEYKKSIPDMPYLNPSTVNAIKKALQ